MDEEVYGLIPYNKKLVSYAQMLRKNMTKEEKHLWYDFLKKLPITVKRQHNIENYIVDFYIAKNKIVIELDGAQHFDEEMSRNDQARDTKLKKWGITVLRYTNEDVNMHFNSVTEDILLHLNLTWDDLAE